MKKKQLKKEVKELKQILEIIVDESIELLNIKNKRIKELENEIQDVKNEFLIFKNDNSGYSSAMLEKDEKIKELEEKIELYIEEKKNMQLW